MKVETISMRDPDEPFVQLAPVQRPGAAPVPQAVLMPHERWKQWVGDRSGVEGGSFLMLLSDDEWPLDGAYLTLGLHANDCPRDGAMPVLSIEGGITEVGPVATICAEWPDPNAAGDLLVLTTLDAGEPRAREMLLALAEQETVPLLLCEASTASFIGQLALTPGERWRLCLRRVLAETAGALPCGPRRHDAAQLVRAALCAGKAVPTRSVIGRNDPCPCTRTGADGRPRKFKRCCGAGA